MSEAMRYPELSDELKARGFGAILRIFGPGAIIASVTIGSGETVFASRGGAGNICPDRRGGRYGSWQL